MQNAHENFLTLCQMVLLPNINFLISRQNKLPKIDTKNVEAVVWYQKQGSITKSIVFKFSLRLCEHFASKGKN